MRSTILMPNFNNLVRDTACKIDYEKIGKVFSGKHTSEMYDRHAAILDKIARIYADGFPVSELGEILNIVRISKSKLDRGEKDILPALCRVLAIFSLPLMDDHHLNTKDTVKLVVELIDEHSLLMDIKNAGLHDILTMNLLSLSDLGEIALAKQRIEYIIYICHSLLVNNKPDAASIMKESNAIKRLLDGIVTDPAKTDSAYNETTLRFLRKVSISVVFINKIIEANGLTIFCNLMQTNTNNSYMISYIVEIIWNILDSPASEAAGQILSQTNCLSQIRNLFADYVKRADRSNEKQLRNEIGILAFIILSVSGPEYGQFKSVGIFNDILTYLMPVENGERPSSYPHYVSNCTEDYEFKKLLLQFTSFFCDDQLLLKECIQRGVAPFILLHLNYDSKMYTIKQWSLRQLKGLQLIMVGLLSKIIVTDAALITKLSVGQVLSFLDLVILYESADLEKGRNNSSSDNIGLVPEVLRCILGISEVGLDSKKLLGQSGVFRSLFRLLQDQSQITEVWYLSLLICSSLCRRCGENKKRFGDACGVEILVNLIRFKSPDTNEEDALLLSVAECVWGAVCGSKVNEDQFFQKEGVFQLLNLLEIKSGKLRKHLLSTLLDLLENPKTRYHVLEWRRKTTKQIKGIGNFLIELWGSEEVMLQVPQGEHGILEKLKSPLVGLAGFKNKDRSKYEFDGSVVNEITENLRAKIYSLFCKLGFEYFTDLSSDERVKLELISRYLDFKVGEVWEEISQELYLERIRPVSPDQQCIETSDEVVSIKANAVKMKQMNILH